ncbi:MAG: hypothetical protein ACXW3Z_07520 [Limisphaerales bacterium]
MHKQASEGVPAKVQGRTRGPFYFGWVVFLFVLPFLVVGLLVEAVMWRTGESWPIERVISAQKVRSEALFMRGILDQGFYRFKALNIQEHKPRVLVLGSSRVMEFRKEMFGTDRFYNAGGMIQGLKDLEAFVETKERHLPEVLVLGVDLWWFSARHLPGTDMKSGVEYDAATDWQAHLKAARRFKSSKVYKPALRSWSAKNENIGVEARNSSAGFRSDGSMKYHFAMPTSEEEWAFVDREKPPIPERIKNGEAPFAASSGMDAERVKRFEACLAELTKRGVMVLGFLPPFSAEAAALMESHPGQTKLWHEGRTMIPEMFARQGQVLVDSSSTASLGLDDRYLIDGIHAAETFQVHLLRKFLEKPRVKEKFPKLGAELEKIIAAPGTNPWYGDYGGTIENIERIEQ